MFQLHKILVASDASPDAERAVQLALDLARRTGASVHTLFVEVPYGDSFEPLSLAAIAQQEAREQATPPPHQAPGAASEQPLDVEDVAVEHVVVRDVAVGPAILNYAANHNVDLIVMASQGRRGISHWLLGSIAEEVVRHAPCPVLTIRTTWKALPEGPPSLLVPIDFSEHAREALRQAKALGALLGARLDLLHVVEETLHPAFYGPTVQSIYDVKPDIEERAVEQMKHFYQTTEGLDGDVRFEARPGKAAHEIVQYAEEHKSGLIVMATHGLTGLRRFFIGSVAEKVVRHASCPVLTVKSFSAPRVREAGLVDAGEVATPAR